MRFLVPILLAFVSFLASCGGAVSQGEQEVFLPDGTRIVAELQLTPEAQAQGMMFRTSLAEDRGMLFVHSSEEPRGYWMFQCEIPLDIIWMDRNHRIVEISKETPPCRETADKCPSYGGKVPSTFVLELAAGMAAKHNLSPGGTIRF